MEIPAIVLYGVSGLGLVLAIYPIVAALRGAINVEVANMQLVKLVNAGNVERAHKLCRAVPASHFMRMADRMLPASEDDRGPAAAQRAEDAFRAAYDRLLARQKPILVLALAAAAAGGIALLMTIVSGQMGPTLGMAAVGLTASVIALRSLIQTRSKIPPAAKQLIAALRKPQ